MSRLKDPEPLSKELEAAFAELRKTHGLRALTEDESGDGVNNLPSGVYGFTYSPFLDNFPLFSRRDLRCYEGHKLSDGTVEVLGFLTPEDKNTFETATDRATLHLFAEPEGAASELVRVPASRVLGQVEHSQRGNQGLELTVAPAG